MASSTAASVRSTSTRAPILGYVKANYSKKAMKVNFFTNILNGDATNLLAVDVTGQPLLFGFKSQTYDFEFGDVRTFGGRHVLSYGGNYRHSNFDLSIAPAADSRNEGGGYVQDEIFLGKYVRWLVGARVDKFDVIDNAQFSPRTTLMLKPSADQTVPHFVQPRVPRAVGDQQLSRHDDHQPAAAGADQPRAVRRLQLSGPRRRQQRRPAAAGVPRRT